MTNRTIVSPGIFAGDAVTTIPGTPVSGISYRDAVHGLDAIRAGWPFDRIVDSKDWNQIMNSLTTFTDLLNRHAFLPWSDLVDYTDVPTVVWGSNGKSYKSLLISGPNNGGAIDPVTDVTAVYWTEYGSQNMNGLFVNFQPKRHLKNGNPNFALDGFALNGDSVLLPATVGGSTTTTALTYSNAANAIVWNKSNPAAVVAAATDWVSFRLDTVNQLIHVVLMSTAVNKLYLASINSTGTVTAIGAGATPSITLTQVAHAWGGDGTAKCGGASLIRAVEGTGNFTLTFDGRSIILNSSTGAIISETVDSTLKGAFKSSGGVSFRPWDYSAQVISASGSTGGALGAQSVDIASPVSGGSLPYALNEVFAPPYNGLAINSWYDPVVGTNASGPSTLLEWNGEYVLLRSVHRSVGIIFDKSEYSIAANNTVNNYRGGV